MPTTLPRHTITETPDVAAVLDEAARRHPGLSRQQLLRVVVLEAGQAQQDRREVERVRLRALFEHPDPQLTGLDGAEQLRRMRAEDWPE